jgi:redox-sensitive bicupin YhaK (pirin superfamily)
MRGVATIRAMNTNRPSFERFEARSGIVGTGLKVARALPGAQRRMVGAWCFLDHAGPADLPPGEGMFVGPHPHIGLQTFTWMIDGELLHRDSLGCEQLLRPGQVNLMTAGRGIVHSEESPTRQGGALHAAQLWIALPDARRDVEPAFAHHPELPQAGVGAWRATVLVGEALGLRAPAAVHTPMVGIDLAAANSADGVLELDAAFEHGFVCLEGRASIDAEVLEPGALLYAAPGRERVALRCDARARVLIVGGAPFESPRILWWNFVARTHDEVAAAAADWRNGSERFPALRGTALERLAVPSLEGVHLAPSRADGTRV